MMSNQQRTFAVAVKLGATKTGIYAISGTQDTPLTPSNVYAATVVTPIEGDGFQFSSASRTMKRHQIRGKTRFALARRLINAIADYLLDKAKQVPTPMQKTAIRDSLATLLRRRGFTYADNDLSIFDSLNPDVFLSHPMLDSLAELLATHPYFSGFFGYEAEGLPDYERIEALLNNGDFPSKKEFKEYVKSVQAIHPDANVNTYIEAFGALVEEANAIISLRMRGNKSRHVYQSDVMEEVTKNKKLRMLLPALGGSVGALSRILCHVSNLDLRSLRHYFADLRCNESNHFFDQNALKETLLGTYSRFAGGVRRQKESDESAILVSTLKASTDVLDMWSQLDPSKTIPPFENMNNRRTPDDLTLFLSPQKLNQYYPRWTAWADKILIANPELAENLDEILTFTDRKSRRRTPSKGHKDLQLFKLSYVLQRAMDRNQLLDPYAIRRLVTNPTSRALQKPMAKLTATIGGQNVEPFLNLAANYYQEISASRFGLFDPQESKCFERADIHPPLIQKILPFLIGSVLRCELDEADNFMKNVWSKSVVGMGRRTIKSACAAIETARKEEGKLFNQEYKAALNRKVHGLPKKDGDKVYLNIEKLVDGVSRTIAEAMRHDEAQRAKYANPYSLAQLYTLLEVKRNGYSSISVAARLENAWRNRTVTVVVDGVERTCANATHLPSDSTRPFDGMLAKVLDRQAYEVAKMVGNNIREHVMLKNADLQIPILVEHDRFSFDLSLSELKRIKNARAEKGMKREDAHWQAKNERIKAANLLEDDSYICPWTGKPFRYGQFSMILKPRHTRASEGHVFDLEANLLYASEENVGELMGLESLHPAYLKHVFGTTDFRAIEVRIEDAVSQINAERRLSPFFQLTQEEQTYVRHALFLGTSSPAYQAVRASLRHYLKTPCNGTQAWFIKCLITKLKDQLADWSKTHHVKLNFNAQMIEPETVNRLRMSLSELDPALKKDDAGSVFSPVIDAACVASAGWYSYAQNLSQKQSLRDVQVLQTLIPKTCDVIRITAKKAGESAGKRGQYKVDPFTKSVFKDTLYGESFMPLYSSHGALFVGYREMKESVARVEGNEPEALLRLLAPFFDQTEIKPLDESVMYTINATKAFEFLHKMAHEMTNNAVMLEQASVLEGLHYFTLRPDLSSVLLTQSGDKMRTEEELIAEVEAGTKVKIALRSVQKGVFKVSGVPALPVRNIWMNLIKHRDLAPHYGEPFTAGELDRVMPMLKSRAAKCNSHRSNKWSYSLPLVVNASGTPVRIRRTNYRGEALFQTQTTQSSTSGFAMLGKQVNWKEPVLMEHLTRDAFTVLGARKKSHDQTIALDEWRLVCDNPVKIWLSPGTAQRCKMRIEGSFDLLKPWLNAQNPKLNFSDGRFLPGAMATKPGADFKQVTEAVFGTEIAKIFDKPKSRIVFSRVGRTVVLTFTPMTSNKAMKMAFDTARK